MSGLGTSGTTAGTSSTSAPYAPASGLISNAINTDAGVQNTANNSFNQQNSLENSLLNARRYYGQQVYGGM